MTTTAPEPTVRDLWKKDEADAAQRFAGDTAEHQLTVLRDDGLYKHLRFKKPGTGMYRYDLVTWPGYLTFCGDMGTLVFFRTEDMLSFFRSNPDRPTYRINPDYWSQKVVDGGTDSVRRFSAPVLRASILEHITELIGGPCEGWPDRPLRMGPETAERFRFEVERDVLAYLAWGEHEAMNALSEFRFVWHDTPEEKTTIAELLGAEPVRHEVRFEDYYDLTRTEYDFRFLWALHGIVTGIEKYDAWAAQPVFSSPAEPNRWSLTGEWVDTFMGADEPERMRLAQRALDAAVAAHDSAASQHEARIADLESALTELRASEGARA
jgi:hypothetical protein